MSALCQLHLPQQWPNLGNTGPINGIGRYLNKVQQLVIIRVGVISKPHVSTPKSFTFVLKSTMNTKKWYLKVNNHPLIGFLVL